jgi:hypothetical protein
MDMADAAVYLPLLHGAFSGTSTYCFFKYPPQLPSRQDDNGKPSAPMCQGGPMHQHVYLQTASTSSADRNSAEQDLAMLETLVYCLLRL